MKALIPLLLFALPSLAEQYANFSGRTTQGWSWTYPAKIAREKILITVQPDHLDVEHELELKAITSWSSPEFPNSLELIGDLHMDKSTVITGFLLWNGNKILKGKLQAKQLARQKYEEVVDRNVKTPQPPRDPALLEKVSEGRYGLSIFPVALNQSRKIRIRYLIPAHFEMSGYQCPFPHAFGDNATVTIMGASQVQGYALISRKKWFHGLGKK